jgi:translation initiation factor 3 subunit M
MASSSTLVNVADDAEIRLVSVLAEASGTLSLADCETCIQNQDVNKLLQLVLKDAGSMQTFYRMQSADEAVSCFSILAALVEKTDQPSATAATLVASIVRVADSTQEGVGRTLRLLSVVYNMRSEVNEKVALMATLFATAGKFPAVYLKENSTLGNLLNAPPAPAAALAPSPPFLVTNLDSWQVGVPARRVLYDAIAAALPAGDSRKQRFLLLLVESYDKSTNVDPIGLQAAKEAAIGAIRDPIGLFRHQRSLLILPAMHALEKKQPALVALLRVFQEGKLSDYQFYLKSQGGEAALAQFGLNPTACQSHMRILSLCSLAAEHEEIPYEIVATTLDIKADQVESQVIAAVNSGLLEAKMDQLVQKVMVERCVVRKFDLYEWKGLQKRLQTWRKNVGGVLEALKQSDAATSS